MPTSIAKPGVFGIFMPAMGTFHFFLRKFSEIFKELIEFRNILMNT